MEESRVSSSLSIKPVSSNVFDNYIKKNPSSFFLGVSPGSSQGRQSFFAMQEKTIVGVLQIEQEGDFAEVVSNAVRRGYRNKGINGKMLSALARHLQRKKIRCALIQMRRGSIRAYPKRTPFKDAGHGFLAWQRKERRH